MAFDWEGIPRWMHGLKDVLPEDVAAVYFSEDDDPGSSKRQGRLLAASPLGLFGCHVTAETRFARGGWESAVTVHWLPLQSVAVAGVAFRAGRGGEEKDQVWANGHEVTVLLDKELPKFGKELTLPLEQGHYQGDRTKAREAARQFIVDLIEMGRGGS